MALLLAAPAAAQPVSSSPASPPKWGAHLDLEGKIGNQRALGEGDLFVPLLQNNTTMLFGNIKARMDDNASSEGNFGLGVRHMLDAGWNLGAYGYFDRRRTEHGNYFNQATLGAEALSLNWDFRANLYLPEGRRSHQVDSLSTAEISGTSVIFRGGEERSLRGFDAEIGYRVPVFEASADRQLRLYAGGYRFTSDEDLVSNVQGPRGRVEMTFDEVEWLWQGARVALGGEMQSDKPRGNQAFLSARLRVPLQLFGQGRSVANLTPMERRMTDPVVRDIDVVAQAGAFGAPETATQLANGQSFTVFNSATTTGAALPGAVAGAGSNVILAGSFSTTASVTLNAGQSLMGNGVTVRSPSGRTAVLTNSATISGAVGGANPAVDAANNSTISGLTISNTIGDGNGANAVQVSGVTGVTIANNTITATQQANNSTNGVLINGGGSATVTGNTISVLNGGAAAAINLFNGTATIANNTLSASGGTVASRFLSLSAGVTVNTAASTGNTATAGVCSNGGANGFASFSDGTTCP